MNEPSDDRALEDSGLGARFEVVESYSGGEGWSGAVREATAPEVLFLKILDPGVEVLEASLLASLQHPRIPRVLEIGRADDGRAYLLREHFDGVPLTRDLPLGEQATVELATQLLEVLAYVHLRGILHLDLKPANVLRRGEAGDPRYALLDFGLGRRGRGPALGGTLFYAAPERLLGMEPDERSDLFSLGALLFIALRGPMPPARIRAFCERFPREDFFAAAGVAPSELAPPLNGLLPRMLARRADDRWADAQEALEMLVGGTGRPSTTLLRPDPIVQHGGRLRQVALGSGVDLVIEGGDAADRHALALHAGCTLDAVEEVEEGEAACVVRRGGAGRTSYWIEAMTVADLARHLSDALGLDPKAAEPAAQRLRESGADTPDRVARALINLVEQGRILPDGPRWIWPDAVAGRLDLGPPDELPAEPDALRRAAAQGQVEAALRAYRRVTAGPEPRVPERELRAALAEGLLRGGEPGRALPLLHDLPALRARALFDLGRVREAERQLRDVESGAVPSSADAQALAYLGACIDYGRGDLLAAEWRLGGLVKHGPTPEHRVLLGLVLARLGRARESVEVLQGVLRELEPKSRPFLCAATLTNLAEAERALGDLGSAQAHHERALRLSRALGHVRQTATSSNNLGVIAKDRGLMRKALDHLRRARALFQHVHDDNGAALAEANLGVVCLEAGDAHSAVRRLQNALEELDRLGSRQDRPLLLVLLARAHALLGERDQAVARIEEAGTLSGRLMDEADKVRRLLDADTPSTPHDPTERVIAGRPVLDAAFQTFLAVNRRLASEGDLEQAMRFLLDSAVTLTGGRLGYLLVVRPDGLRMEVGSGQSTQDAVAFSRSMVNRALQRRQVLTGTDALADRELTEMPSVRDLNLRSAVCVPFVSASGTEGAIYVEHPGRPNVFGHAEKAHLDVLADQAAIAVDRMLHEERLATELEQSRRDLQAARRASRAPTATMLGKSKAMKILRETVDKLARSDLAVLILGETGTGKELVARALHEQSTRRSGNFVSENCSAIPTELMESELFGYRKGAFTGADEDRAGLLELASGGTLFLDEVGDMAPALQAKLLRVLQEKQARRVGDQRTIPVDIRLVAATHRDLLAMVGKGEFREDLYYRLAAAEIRVPPLRTRDRDVLLLAEEFLARLNREHRRDVQLTEVGRQSLLEYPWPGNVRELEHVIARAFILAEGEELSSFDLREVTPGAEATSQAWPVITLAEAEARTIRAALESTGGDKTKAAKVLEISRTALYEKLKRMEKRDS